MNKLEKVSKPQNIELQPVPYDIEVYPNFFILVCRDEDSTTGYKYFSIKHREQFRAYISKKDKLFIGFNNTGYDDLVLKAWLEEKVNTEWEMFVLSQSFIQPGKTVIYENNKISFSESNNCHLTPAYEIPKPHCCKYHDDVQKKNNLRYFTKCYWGNSFDLMSCFRTDDSGDFGTSSLKELAIRLQHDKLQDLPLPFDSFLQESDKKVILEYCVNDVVQTVKLWNKLFFQAELRQWFFDKYGVNVMEQTNSQICENVFAHMYEEKTGLKKKDLKELVEKPHSLPVKELIPDFIKFKSKNLSILLNEMKSKNINIEHGVKPDSSFFKISVTIGETHYQLGIGGIHSKDSSGIYEQTDKEAIVEADVVSYYPSIIKRCNLHPEHLTEIWLDNFCQVFDERLKAKKSGDKLSSESLKLMINSAYGKTGNKYSFMFSFRVMLSVTLTGQLALLMLIEELEEKGIKVLSANTDGIIYKCSNDDLKKANTILSLWETLTGFKLEVELYSKYIRQNVNNYMTMYKNTGLVKTKGYFDYGGLHKKQDDVVIKKAIQNYFLHGVAPEKTVRDEVNLHHFIFSYKCTRGFKLYYVQHGINEKLLQKTNRWYVSTNKDSFLYKQKTNKIKVNHGEGAVIVNDMPEELPEDIDYNYYSHLAWQYIYKIESRFNVSKFEKKGLSVLPKYYKKNAPGTNTNNVTKWSNDAFDLPGLGIYTGLHCQTIVIDIDYPEKLSQELIGLLSDSLVIYHGEGNKQQVLDGKLRGKIVYKCSNTVLSSSSSRKNKLHEKFGIEIIYGGRTAQVWGLHPSGTHYKTEGKLKEISLELETWLLENSPITRFKSTDNENLTEIFEDYEPTKADINLFFKTVKSILPNHKLEEVSNGDTLKLIGECPYSDQHTNISKDTHFNIFLGQNGLPNAGCFHTSCSESIASLSYSLRNYYIEQKRIKDRDKLLEGVKYTVPEKILEATKLDDFTEAFENKEKNVIIKAPTGSGKTYKSALHFIKCVSERIPVFMVCSNKTDQIKFVELVEELTGLDIDDMYCQILQGQIDSSAITDNIKVSKSTIGIIAHHTYAIGRKGVSNYFFSIYKWIKEYKPVLIIDEADTFCQKANHLIQIGGRYLKRASIGSPITNFERVTLCPAFAGNGKCTNCIYRDQHQQYDVNSYQIPFIKTAKTISTKDILANDTALEIPQYYVDNDHKKRLKKLEVWPITKHKNIESMNFNCDRLIDGEYYNLKAAIQNMIDFSYKPCVYVEKPTLDDEFIEPEEINSENKKQVKFPYNSCNVPTLSLKDMACLEWFRRHARKLIMMSATFTSTNLEYLNDGLKNIRVYNITESKQKIDELLIIGVEEGITFTHATTKGQKKTFLSGLSEFGKTLVFTPKFSTAKRLFHSLPKDLSCGAYYEDSVNVKEKYAQGQWLFLITYSLGPLGAAINMPEFYTVFTDSLIFKPTIAYDLKTHTEEELEELREEDRLRQIIQNVGRILRGNKGRKAIVISHSTKDIIKKVSEENRNLVRGDIKTTFFKNDIVAITECLYDWHRNGKVQNNEKPKVDEKTNPKRFKKMIDEGKIDVKYTIDNDEILTPLKGKYKKVISGMVECKVKGLKWSTVSKKLKLTKTVKSQNNRAILKEIYNTMELMETYEESETIEQ